MAMMDKVKKLAGKAAGFEKYAALDDWQKRLDEARRVYEPELVDIARWEELYLGSRQIERGANARTGLVKDASNIRNITFELIESQVDSELPLPKVSPMREAHEGNARAIESALRADLDRLPFEYLNDEQERTT